MIATYHERRAPHRVSLAEAAKASRAGCKTGFAVRLFVSSRRLWRCSEDTLHLGEAAFLLAVSREEMRCHIRTGHVSAVRHDLDRIAASGKRAWEWRIPVEDVQRVATEREAKNAQRGTRT
jgi:hypothetical protein